ncbi:MAG: cation diffusion facilitator family transporter [Thermodesulfovibrionales bacterium]|jgi:cation diffusion facilitator family transporter|nr:cation diffusion facilitator family transporter [Thermodesulfovibrionales bacterium]
MGKDHSIKTDYPAQVRKVLIATLILNVLVALAKAVYGFITNSVAMVSDGFHSFFDGASNVIGLVGIWIASNPPDEKHPYGHKKYETLFTIIIAVMLFTTCFEILKKVYQSFHEDHKTLVTQTSFLIMIMTTGVNIFVMLYEKRKGKQLGSEFLIADAKHTKSDIVVSLTVIASLVFSRMGYPHADVIVGLIIAIFIARIGYEILKDASNVLVDTVCLNTRAVESLVNSLDGVRGCHDIRTRGSENSIYLDLHVLVGRNLSTEKSHEIADSIEETIKREFPSVVDIVVHVEPEISEK